MIILFFLLFFCAWLQSLHILPWVSWHSELLMFLAIALCAGIAAAQHIRRGTQNPIALPLITIPFLFFAVLAIVQVPLGLINFAGDALVFCLYMALCITSLTLGFAAGRTSNATVCAKRSPLELVAFTIVATALASSIVAMAQTFELWNDPSWINPMPALRRPGGNVGQPNHLATLLLMGMASLVFLYESCKLKALTSALLLVTLVVALGMTESRTGVLSLLLMALWWAVKSRTVKFKLSGWFVAFGVVAVLGFFWLWPSIFDVLLQTGVSSKVNTSSESRLSIWPQLLQAVALRPWLGWGLNQVSEAHNAVAHLHVFSSPFSYSHNILIDLALGIGVPLTLLVVLITGVWLWRRMRQTNQLAPWYCMAVVLPVAVHSMLEFPFTYAYFLVPVMLVLGLQEGLSGAKRVLKIDARFAAALLLVISTVGAWSVVEYVQVEEDFRIARFEALRVGQTPAEYERPHIVLLTQLDALLAGARIVPKPEMSDDELALAKKVALRYPWTATQNRYALSLALNGYPDEAVRQLRVMRALHGANEYKRIKESWQTLADEKYPQLRLLILP